jgi:hypothetical protein
MEKLKILGILRENPGFNFLQECWQNDPALQIALALCSKAKFPQWEVACVDQRLVEWDG